MEDIITALQFAAEQDAPHFVSEEQGGVQIVRPEGSVFVPVARVEDGSIIPIA